MKKILIGMFVMFCGSAILFAAIDSGNKFCPVTGDKIKDRKHFVEYQGQQYAICCKMCSKKFNNDPAKYIAEMNQKAPSSSDPSMHSH